MNVIWMLVHCQRSVVDVRWTLKQHCVCLQRYCAKYKVWYEDDCNTKFWLIIFLIRRHQYILYVIKSQLLNVFGCLKYLTRFDGLCIYNESSSCYGIPVNIQTVDATWNAYHKRRLKVGIPWHRRSRVYLCVVETFSLLVETET